MKVVNKTNEWLFNVAGLGLSKKPVRGISKQDQAAARRAATKNAMAKTLLGVQNTQNCKVLPDRNLLLDCMPKNAVCAEVGVAFGDFSAEILKRTSPACLYLVDAWESDRYRLGLSAVQERFSETIATGIVQIRTGHSTEVLATFPDEHLDWAYIDTNHRYETTLQELLLCHMKVKKNGMICGHDFCSGNVVKPVVYGVVEACEKFCADMKWQFEYLTLESHCHFSFGLSRI